MLERTWMRDAVGDGDAVGVWVAVDVGLGDPEAVGVAEAVGVGDPVGLEVGVPDGVGELPPPPVPGTQTPNTMMQLGDGLGLPLGQFEGDGLGEPLGDGQPC